MNYLITGKNYTSGLFQQLDKNEVRVINEEEIEKSDIVFYESDKLYVASESALDTVLKKSTENKQRLFTKILKNKLKFRNEIKQFFPEFYYKQISLNSLNNLKLSVGKEFIIKPSKGFFGTAVRKINSETDLNFLQNELAEELKNNTVFFSEAVLSKNTFIIEEFVEGEEYAVDMFYNNIGIPIIVNIYRHPFHINDAYFHSIYYTGRDIFNEYKQIFEEIFVNFNKKFGIKNFPIHCEFKINNEKIIPIEFNPLRFGGFGLADLTFYAFNINPFEYFFQNKEPNWNDIWNKSKSDYYAWILGYNAENIDIEEYSPNHPKYKNNLGEYIKYIELDYKKNPAFSIAYLKLNNLSEVEKYTTIEYTDYFIQNEK